MRHVQEHAQDLEHVQDLGQLPRDLTLLDLVSTVAEFAADEREIVATVLHMIRSGRVRLAGSFKDDSGPDFGN